MTAPKFYGAVAFLIVAGCVGISNAQPVAVPNHFDPRERLEVPDISGFGRLRFLTTTDFPPFNFLDEAGRLSGFHVDLIRAICDTLDVEARCEIQALPWPELRPALEDDRGEVIAAGIAVTDENRQDFAFTRPFLKLPARFLVREDDAVEGEAATEFAGERVGVLEGSAHEAMLDAFFPDVEAVPLPDAPALFQALKDEDVRAIFDDGVRLSFFLGSEAAAECCRFFDRPFFSDRFLGLGLALAVAPEDEALAQAFDHALMVLSNDGRLAEIYLRYFPEGLY